MPAYPTLVLLPSLTATTLTDGRLRITRKFLEGVEQFRQHWPGRVSVLLEEATQIADHLDPVDVDPNHLPFSIKITRFDALTLEPDFQKAGLVLGSAGWRQNQVPRWCQRLGISCVMTTEYSLKTRQQMVQASAIHPVRRLKRQGWEWLQEYRQTQAIRRAQGVQCNGTPTFAAYRDLNPNPLLFFDSRVSSEALISSDQFEQRLGQCLQGERLRLLFSGRLIAIKGASHLIEVADHLRRWGVDFDFTICGEGDSFAELKSAIQRRGLESRVHLRGTLDFHRELLPLVRQSVDLFVCCHRQGDPSCTYLETMSCGVPIVGYANEAFEGVVHHSGAGWLTPMNEPRALARQIAQLDADRGQIVRHANRARAFASHHTFENTFRRRIEHLQGLAPT